MLKKLIICAVEAAVFAGPSLAQSVPQKLQSGSGSMLVDGYVPTAPEWTAASAGKQDVILPGAQNAIVTLDSTIDSTTTVFLNDAGVNKWQLVKTSSNSFALWDTTASRNVFTVASGGAFTHVASTASAASLNIPQGTAPTSPNNGDIWMTSAGLYYRFNGTTHGPL